MIRNLLVFVLFATSSCVVLYGQTPGAKKERDNAPRVFSWSFEGDGSYLGVETQEVNRDNFAKFGLRDVRGVAVEKVLDNSPAQAGGLQNGDVIVRFNGDEVTSTRKLTRLISEVAPDHQAKLTVVRGGSERDLTVTLAKRPAPKFENGNFEWATPMPPMGSPGEMPKMPEMPDMSQLPKIPNVLQVAPGEGGVYMWSARGSRQIGVGLTPLTKQLGDYFGVADGNGLLITNVRENSPAAKVGLKAGDVIVEADGKTLKGDFDLIKLLNEKKEGDVELTIIRDRGRQTVRVTPEAVKNDLTPLFENSDREGTVGPPTVASPAFKGMLPSGILNNLLVPGRVL